MQLIVTGTPESGRSGVEGILRNLGCSPGLEVSGNDATQTETGERVDVSQINEWLLQVTGASPGDPVRFKPEDLSIDILDEFRQRSGGVIAELDGGSPCFLSGPLFSLTLPLWKLYLEEPLVVFVYSHPAEFGPPSASESQLSCSTPALWEFYVCRALAACRSLRTFFVRGESARENPAASAASLLAALKDADASGSEVLAVPEPGSFSVPTGPPGTGGSPATLTPRQKALWDFLEKQSKTPRFQTLDPEAEALSIPSDEAIEALAKESDGETPANQRINGNDALRHAHEGRLRQIEAYYAGKLQSREEAIAGDLEEKDRLVESLQRQVAEETSLRKKLQELLESLDRETRALGEKPALSKARIKAALRVLRLGGQRSQFRAFEEFRKILPDKEREND